MQPLFQLGAVRLRALSLHTYSRRATAALGWILKAKQMNIPELVKCVSKDCRCPCGGQAMIDGEGTVRLPFGLGYAPGSVHFQIDVMEYRGWHGECMECGKELLFWRTRKARTQYPASINQKLAAARL